MELSAIILHIILINVTFSECNEDVEVDMIKDVIESYNKPTSVFSKLNWQKSRLIYLVNALSKMRKPVKITTGRNGKTEEIERSNNILFLFEAANNNTRTLLKEADAYQQFRRSYRWLVLETQGSGYNSILPEIEHLNILIDSDVLLATKMDNCTYNLHKIYKITSESEWIFENFGRWTKEYGLIKLEITGSNALRRRNIRRHSVKNSIVITDDKTKSELDDPRNFMTDSVGKIGYRHTKSLCEFMNATHTVIFTSMWGFKTNGTWHGMMGDLSTGVTDFGGTISFLSVQRMEIVDFLSDPVPITSKFVFRDPPLSYQNNLFILPYKENVWYCTAALVILLVIILYVNAKWEMKKVENQGAVVNEINLQPNLSDITVLVISAITQQGCSNELKGTLGRIVFFILFLTFLFLYTSYSANIVALLQSNSKQIRTLKDLLNSKLELGAEDTSYNKYYLSVADEPIRKAIYETKIAPKESKPNFIGIEEGVKKIRKNPFAFNMNLGTGYKIIERYFEEHEKCALMEIDYFGRNFPWASCRKNSPFKEIYKLGLFRIKEHGITDRENNLMFGRKPVCMARGGDFDSVNMMDIYPVILMLLYGMLLAICLLFIEIMIHRYARNSWKTLCINRIM